MKTILLFLFFILMTPTVNAQTTVTNNTNCAVKSGFCVIATIVQHRIRLVAS